MKLFQNLSLLFLVFGTSVAIDNGFGITPPMGWRSWNQFQCNINQDLIIQHYHLLATQYNGVSLLEVGYNSAGIDDCWQLCNSGPGGVGFHNASGYPIVNTKKFPDMKAMTEVAKSLNIIPGWYGNNCDCKETRCNGDECFRGDVQATLDYGFQSIKLDGCGVEKNITKYAALFNATGVPVMLENCHNGNPTYPTTDNCPFNFFRSSGDIRPTFGSILSNLETTAKYNGPKITGPGCWAYPDMLEVGVTNSGKPGYRTLSFVEARTHFGAWCIVSSPLILGMDLRNSTKLAEVWPIITNKEAIAVNQAWAGDAGVQVSKSSTTIRFIDCHWGMHRDCDHPTWQVMKKKLSNQKTAVLLMNNANNTDTISVDYSDVGIECGSKGCSIRDIWSHKDDGIVYNSTILSVPIDSRDSSFKVITML